MSDLHYSLTLFQFTLPDRVCQLNSEMVQRALEIQAARYTVSLHSREAALRWLLRLQADTVSWVYW
ncbi:hypothetical protein [Deinococcus apachensis]|uniref:hypothetical protein n=1 Tax=Deinococcus apachensis TaxID=309886 RepID=UPI0003622725|nr:hypothetical protein [Deinococcus apachensis]